MLELLKKLDKKDAIDLNEEIKNLELENNEALLISRYIVENNKAIVRKAYNVENTDVNIAISDELLELIDRIKNKEYIEGIEDIYLVQLLNRGIAKAIENIKIEYSLSELISDTYLYTIEFYNKYFETMDRKIVLDVFDQYISIIQLQIQNKKIKEQFYNEIGISLYAIIKKELLKDRQLKDIIKERNITEDYYNYLDNYYSDYEIDLEADYEQLTKQIKEEYDITYNSFLLDYIDTSIFIDYLEINGEKTKILATSKELQRILSIISEYEY